MGWFSPRCPVSDEEKLWLEDSAKWLVEEFGIVYIKDVPVVLPNQDFFPESYDGSEDDVEALLKKVCGFIDIDPSNLNLQFYRSRQNETRCNSLVHLQHHSGSSSGYFKDGSQIFTIGIETSQLNNHIGLIGTMAHELGHVILLGERRISPLEKDQEFLTDLLTVFLGLGIFTANSAILVQTSSCGWRAQKNGYLTEEMYGYALALFAHLRKEKKPYWSKFLNTNVSSYFKNSYKYIEKNGTSLAEFM